MLHVARICVAVYKHISTCDARIRGKCENVYAMWRTYMCTSARIRSTNKHIYAHFGNQHMLVSVCICWFIYVGFCTIYVVGICSNRERICRFYADICANGICGFKSIYALFEVAYMSVYEHICGVRYMLCFPPTDVENGTFDPPTRAKVRKKIKLWTLRRRDQEG